MKQNNRRARGLVSRRRFIGTGLAIGAGAVGASLLPEAVARASDGITTGDAAILRFAAALEILETDFWQQYNELGGIQDSEVPGGSGSKAYTKALVELDSDMPQYIHDNTEDEFTHFDFLNHYLMAQGASAVSLENFRTLAGSQATGADKSKKRLTNLMRLTLDTSWWTRYRSRTKNPDPPFSDTFPQAVPALATGEHTAIPRDDKDLVPKDHLQFIANTAGFHFATIEQGGSSLYPSMAQRATSVEVLRILISIGPTETMHFQTWQDKAGNAPAITDPTTGLSFPDLNKAPFDGEDFQTNLIMPEPTVFLDRKFPPVSIIRPTETTGVAHGAVKFLTDMGLFRGQSQLFFTTLNDLATQADAARRGV